MSNLNKSYHKGKYRGGEWAKHLRPYLKRKGNKRWRKEGRKVDILNIDSVSFRKRKKVKPHIKVKITKLFFGDIKITNTSKYRNLRDAKNAMNQGNVIKAEILNEDNYS